MAMNERIVCSNYPGGFKPKTWRPTLWLALLRDGVRGNVGRNLGDLADAQHDMAILRHARVRGAHARLQLNRALQRVDGAREFHKNAVAQHFDDPAIVAPDERLQDVPVPAVGPNDVLIRILKTGICGTDLHIYLWDAWAQQTIPVPMVVGHEFVGRVERVGSNVTGFQPGDLVSGEGHLVCGRCRNCLAGRRHLCKDTKGIGVNRPGAFAEFISVPMTNVWHHADGVDKDVASIFDPFGNAVHTALSFPVLRE